MFLGLILLVMGALLAWMVSGILGGICIFGGVIKVGLALVTVEKEVERREYDSGPKTYTLHSKPARAKT